MTPRIKLKHTEYIVTAYAQSAQGPGWANTPIWVVIKNSVTGKTREHCIQPANQTQEMITLYGFSAMAHAKMVTAVQRILSKQRIKP